MEKVTTPPGFKSIWAGQYAYMITLTDDITSFLPQRTPFVMIDQLTRHEEKMTRSVFLIKEHNILVENGRFCEAGLVENIAQTAAAREGYASGLKNKPVRIGYIGAIKNLVIYSLPYINDVLVTEITVENQIFDVILIKGTISCNEVVLAACEMKIFISESK